MRMIFHIGSPKAGSTTLQLFLQRNRAALARQGFRFERTEADHVGQIGFPVAGLTDVGVPVPSAHHRHRYGYPDLAAQEAKTARLFADLAARRPGWSEHSYLASSEYMITLRNRPEALAALDARLRGVFDDVTYLLYLRRQEDFIASMYSQRVRNGHDVPLETFVRKTLKGYDYARIVETWTSVVGRDRLVLRIFDRAALKDGDLIADYCDVCGIDPAGVEPVPRSNEGLTAELLELQRVLNAELPVFDAAGVPQAAVEALRAELDRLAPATGSRMRLPPEMARLVAESVAEGNERLRREWFPDRPSLFPPAPADASDLAAIREGALRIAARWIAARVGAQPGPPRGRKAPATGTAQDTEA
jgi:hypothetical protein